MPDDYNEYICGVREKFTRCILKTDVQRTPSRVPLGIMVLQPYRLNDEKGKCVYLRYSADEAVILTKNIVITKGEESNEQKNRPEESS